MSSGLEIARTDPRAARHRRLRDVLVVRSADPFAPARGSHSRAPGVRAGRPDAARRPVSRSPPSRRGSPSVDRAHDTGVVAGPTDDTEQPWSEGSRAHDALAPPSASCLPQAQVGVWMRTRRAPSARACGRSTLARLESLCSGTPCAPLGPSGLRESAGTTGPHPGLAPPPARKECGPRRGRSSARTASPRPGAPRPSSATAPVGTIGRRRRA